MAKGDELNARQEMFCVALEIDKLSQRQAYIKVYGRGNYSDASLDQKASKLAADPKIRSRCAEIRDKVTDKAVWSKVEMLNDLKGIAAECKSGKVEIHATNGDLLGYRTDAPARGVAVRAIETASKMLGYNAPDKVEHTGTVTVEALLRQVQGDKEY